MVTTSQSQVWCVPSAHTSRLWPCVPRTTCTCELLSTIDSVTKIPEPKDRYLLHIHIRNQLDSENNNARKSAYESLQVHKWVGQQGSTLVAKSPWPTLTLRQAHHHMVSRIDHSCTSRSPWPNASKTPENAIPTNPWFLNVILENSYPHMCFPTTVVEVTASSQRLKLAWDNLCTV